MSLNIENLTKLADYLEKLPPDYKHFAMASYASNGFGNEFEFVGDYACGTSACAVGHGPAAGIAPAHPDETWSEYCETAFGVEEYGVEWEFMFDTTWEDDPKLAAARLRYYVQHGVPEEFCGQLCGDTFYWVTQP